MLWCFYYSAKSVTKLFPKVKVTIYHIVFVAFSVPSIKWNYDHPSSAIVNHRNWETPKPTRILPPLFSDWTQDSCLFLDDMVPQTDETLF